MAPITYNCIDIAIEEGAAFILAPGSASQTVQEVFQATSPTRQVLLFFLWQAPLKHQATSLTRLATLR
jgi:hypothetical protein